MDNYVSDMEKQIECAANLVNKVDLMNILVEKIIAWDFKKSIEYSTRASQIAKEISYTKGFAVSIMNQGIAYQTVSSYDKSIPCLNEALEYFKQFGDDENQIKCINVLGIDYFYLGKFQHSLELFLQGNEKFNEKFAMNINFKKLESKILNNIGEIYKEVGQFDKAYENYKKAYKMAVHTKDTKTSGIVLSNIAEILEEYKKYDLSLCAYKKCLQIFSEVSDPVSEADCINKLGSIFYKLGNEDLALSYYKKSYNMLFNQDEKFYRVDTLINIADYYLNKKCYEKAKEYLFNAFETSKGIKASSKMCIIYKMFSRYYREIEDYKNAFYNYEKYNELKGELTTRDVENKLGTLVAEMEVKSARNEAEIYKKSNAELKKKSEELERSYKSIAVISEIGRKITSTFDFDEMYAIIIENISLLMDVSNFGIAVYDEETGRIDYKIYIGEQKIYNNIIIDINDKNSFSAWCIRNRKEIIMKNVSEEYPKYVNKVTNIDSENTAKSVVQYPLTVGNKILGSIAVQSNKKNAYSFQNIDTLSALTSYVAIALNNSQKSYEIKQKAIKLEQINEKLSVEVKEREKVQNELEKANRKLEKISACDFLTGLANRRKFHEYIESEWKKIYRSDKPVSILMLDIDHFKQFNDRFGHQIGDQCLKSVAESMRISVKKPGNFIARYGGEEFVVILPDTGKEQARIVAENIRNAIEKIKIIPYGTEFTCIITASLGIYTHYPDDFCNDDAEKFIRNADIALYRAKSLGRNRVEEYN